MSIDLVIVDIERCRSVLSEPDRFCSAKRLEKARRIANGSVRMQSYAAELALSYALSGKRLLPPVYRYEKSGKPVIDNGYISLSHSGRYAVCALSLFPVGVDIEMLRSISPLLGKRILTEEEQALLKVGNDEHYLLRKFVVKEAYLKLTGEGIGGGMNSISEIDGQIRIDNSIVGFAKAFVCEGAVGCVASLYGSVIDAVELSDSLL